MIPTPSAPSGTWAPSTPLLICTDLDRTLIPNGAPPESPGARERFAALVGQPGLRLAYVTGRHLELVQEAMAAYDLPPPHFIITDVGTRILMDPAEGWRALDAWTACLAPDWGELGPADIATLLADLPGLYPQEAEKQGPFKLSYYLPPSLAPAPLLASIRGRLQARGLRVNLVHSLDEPRRVGLLDILPASASKRHAIEFLLSVLGLTGENCVFAGDSGNDLEVLVSPIPAVLVANATPEVRAQALAMCARAGQGDRLYCARGGFGGWNGCYAAGILEGIAHYHPDLMV
ncbi:MAG: HAD-IIB family hydrolase [Gammaproteobacteria bacterium]|nr:MAG: HAD-IIB family hydrolase [Gammaproteobacteria bacterium]